MWTTPQGIVKHSSAKEDNVDGKNTKLSSSDDVMEIRRTLTTDTQSTDYSSGVHSTDLIMDIYSTITEEEQNDNKTDIQDNLYRKKEEEFFNLVRMTSSWTDGKPFDEESLLAMSERGVGSKNTYSKGTGGTEEYILPPANYSEKIVGISPYNKEKYLKIKEPSAKAEVKASPAKANAETSGQDNQADAVKRSFKESEEEPKKESKKCCGVSRKFCCITCILAILLLAGATAAGFLTSGWGNNDESVVSNNQTAAATESPVDTDPSTNNDEPIWGTLITYLDPIPEELYPLGLCAGDCDQNSDCDEGLVCYQRGENDPVPFCFGGENDDSSNDYCTYPSFSGEMPGSEFDECVTRISVVQECFFDVDNVLVVNFGNCDPQDGDWVGVYPAAASFIDETSGNEFVGNGMINWAFTCGDVDCNDSPFYNTFGFPTDHNNGFSFESLEVYLLRNNVGTPEYEVVAKSEPFSPTVVCE